MSAQFSSTSCAKGHGTDDWRSNPEEPTYARGPLQQAGPGRRGGFLSLRLLLGLAAAALVVKVGLALAPDFARYMKISRM